MTRLLPYLLPLLLCSSLFSCKKQVSPSLSSSDSLIFSHASLLHIARTDSYAIAVVRDAWNPQRTLHRYLLLPHNAPVPSHISEATIVRVPLQRVVAFSSIHAALFAELNKSEVLCGVCDVPYLYHKELREHIANGSLTDMGAAISPNIEGLVAAKPDALFVSPFENAGHGQIARLGIPIIECADYMETSPLGRAEWMRFYGLLLGCEDKADSLFAKVEKEYTALSKIGKSQHIKPKLLCDTKSGSAWYMPGGNSTLGHIFADAGADYLFADRKESGSICLSFEHVYQQAREADIWLIKYGAKQPLTYTSLSADFKSYEAFKPWKSRSIYACNTFHTPYYEETPFHPERLLRDLIHIFHPQLLPNYEPKYYQPLD